jgi:hypothetical protein
MHSQSEIIGYARFRSTPEVAARYPVHQPGRWYPVLKRISQGNDFVAGAGMLWLDMGILRGVPADDVEFREGGMPESG